MAGNAPAPGNRLGVHPWCSAAGGTTRARHAVTSVQAIQRLADDAVSGIRIALEVVDRYDTNLLNTAGAALAFRAEGAPTQRVRPPGHLPHDH
jgi:hypothetical protein